MKNRGFSLVELLVVIAILITLLALALPPFIKWVHRQKVENEAVQLYTDLKYAQTEALRQGEIGIQENTVTLADGGTEVQAAIRERKIYVAFNTQNNSYRIFRWQDNNQNGYPDAVGEFSPDFGVNVNEDRPIKNVSFNIVTYGVDPSVTSSACGNNGGRPANPITPWDSLSCPQTTNVFSNNDRCIRFNSKGFFEGFANSVIYLTDGSYSYAIRIALTGTISLCKWTGNGWKRLR